MNTTPQFYKNTTNSAIADSSSVGMLGKNSGHGTKFSRYNYARMQQEDIYQPPSSSRVSVPPSFGSGLGMTVPSHLSSSMSNQMNSTPGLHPYRVEDNVSISASRLTTTTSSNNSFPAMDGRIRPTATDPRTTMDGMMMIGGGARAA